MVLCTGLLAATTLMAKILGSELHGPALHPLQITAGRFCFGLLALTPILLFIRPDFHNTRWALHAIRTTFGWANVSLLFAAVTFLPLADATAISFLSPVITMLLAIPLLRERIGPWRWSAAAIALIGGMIIIRPGTSAFQPAALLALLAAVLMGVEMILIKILTRTEPALRILILANVIGSVIALLAASFVWQWPTATQWLFLAALGATMVSAQSLFIQSMRLADASLVTPIFYSTLVFAAVYDLILFQVLPDGPSIAGASLIVIAALVIAWREQRNKRV